MIVGGKVQGRPLVFLIQEIVLLFFSHQWLEGKSVTLRQYEQLQINFSLKRNGTEYLKYSFHYWIVYMSPLFYIFIM